MNQPNAKRPQARRNPSPSNGHQRAVVASAIKPIIERLEQRTFFTVSTSTPAEASLDSNFTNGSLGVNLNSNDSYRTDALWTDLRNEMNAWSYAGSNGTPLSGADVTSGGYPTGTAADQGDYTEASALGYPDGVYTLQYQGAGTIAVSGDATIVPGSTQTTTVNNVTTTTAQVTLLKDTGSDLVLTANNFTTAAPLSNFHLMMPGFPVTTTQVFNPAVIARLKTFSTLRLMDLFKINNSTLANWSSRPLPTDFTQTGPNGISYEDAIALGNETGVNLWWNIPIDATNTFVTDAADLIKYGSNATGTPYTSTQANPVYAPLNSTLNVTIELANEMFNQGTTSYTANDAAAQANNYLDKSGQLNIDGEESLFRTRQIYDLFSSVYGSSLSSQVGFVWTAYFDSLTGAAETYTSSAITYAGENNGQSGDNNPLNWGPLSSWLSGIATADYHGLLPTQNPTTLTILFADLNTDFQEYGPSAEQAMVYYVNHSIGSLPLLAYEGGVALPLYTNNTTLYTQASSDPRMDTFEQTELDNWYSNGGGAFNQYSFVDPYNYYGYWGLLTSEDQAGNNKFDGIIKRLVPMGDATLDGSVDFSDFLALKANWGLTGASWEQGDFNGDGTVNLADLQLLEQNINTSTFTTAQLAEYNGFIQYATTGTPNSTVGTGLYGSYYSDLNQTAKVFGEVDPTIDFSWPQGQPGPGNGQVNQAYFSAEWTGEIEAPTSETYEFHTYSADGVRVYITVNGVQELIINDYNNGSHEDVGNVTLQAGQTYPIEVQYYEEYGNGSMQLEWQTPTIPLENVPATMLYPTILAPIVTGLTATTGTNDITLSFPAVAGATSYNVYRSTSSGGEGTIPYLTGITGSGSNNITITDSQLTPGRTFYYTVTALDVVGENAQSSQVSAAAAATAGAPAAPTITDQPGAGAVTLNWSSIPAATSYSIYRGTTSGGEGVTALISGITALNYTDTTGLPGTTYYYTVTANDASGSSAFSNQVSGEPTNPGAPTLTDTDIGSPGQAGSASYNTTSGTYTINGGGADIYGTGDQFNFDYTTLSGNQTLIARVATDTDTDYSTKAGLMFRQSAGNADSYADVCVTPGQGVVFEWRNASYGTYSSTAVAGVIAPAWIKLVRSSNTFTGYYSFDGINWTAIASQTIAMNSNLLAGLAVCAHNNADLATAAFTNVTLGSGPAVNVLPAATLNTSGTAATLSVGASEAGNPSLTYTWSVSSLPNGVTASPTFSSSNGTTSGNSVTVAFPYYGTYGFTVTITDPSNQTIELPLSVNVAQILTSIPIIPASPVYVSAGGTVAFAADALDQFGVPLLNQPTFAWSSNNSVAGSINASTGVYTASTTIGASATSTASASGISGSSTVTNIAYQTPVSLTGSPIGTAGSYGNAGNTISNVFDGDLSTYFDAPTSGTTSNPDWVGLDLGAASTIDSITYAPHETGSGGTLFESRMVGGFFQVSNDPTFTTGDVTLATITATPADGYTTIPITAGGSYRYIRYVAPAGSYGNIAELSFNGVVSPPAWLSPASTAIWNPSTHVLTVTGPASIIADPASDEPIIQATGSAAVVTLNPSSGNDIHLGGLSLTNGASAIVTSLGAARSATNYHVLILGTPGATVAPTFNIDSTSTLDLADNDLIDLYGSGTSPYTATRGDIEQSYDGGKWDLPGLTSSIAATQPGSYGLGYAEASTFGYTTFDGVTLGGNAVIVKYTLLGDANLAGSVNFNDFSILQNHYGQADDWSQGDFNYDGTVNFNDFSALQNNMNRSTFP